MKFTLFVFICLLFSQTYCDVVCSEDELIKELREDIEDNGKLDCLREILSPNPAEETPEQKSKRQAAEWNGDCSFESETSGDGDWVSTLQKNYGLEKGLVDVNGDPVDRDFDDQADMCEIIRALIASGKFKGVDDVTNLNNDVLDQINCAGNEGQTQVCAANAGSFANKHMWYILLDGKTMQFDSKPKFIPAPSEE